MLTSRNPEIAPVIQSGMKNIQIIIYTVTEMSLPDAPLPIRYSIPVSSLSLNTFQIKMLLAFYL